MAKLTFFPLGNADACLIDLSDGKKVLFDFGDQKDRSDPKDKRIDLAEALRKDLKEVDRDYFDMVAFTHLDLDHVEGSAEFFWLEHAKKYQGNGRIKIKELWVPAAVICETRPEDDDGRVVQAEARYRFKKGEGIRVFSEPRFLEKWCKDNGVKLEDRKHLITDAGNVIPGFTTADNGVEFFAHCPFAHSTDDAEEFDRNNDSLVVQATFVESGRETKLILGSDADHRMWTEIVKLTRKYKNDIRLEWDIFKLPHHCSYLSLGPEKGKTSTEPVKEVAWLYETQGQDGGIIVSPSKPIPSDDSDSQPPHRQAANYHRQTSDDRVGHFVVTMEHPSVGDPQPLVITIDRFKATIEKRHKTGASAAVAVSAPRAGFSPRAG